ncbi:MAG: hypothetical protein ACQEUT_14005 [Bacillota bacterium]
MENKNINEVKSTHSGKRKFWFARFLSIIFISACLSLLVFFGAAESGLLVAGNGAAVPSGFYTAERPQAQLPPQLKFPELVPFKVVEAYLVEESKEDAPYPMPHWLRLKGEKEQVLHLRYTPGAVFVDQTDENLPKAIKESSVEIQAVKVNGRAGNYHETGTSSFLSWQDGDVSVTISYERGSSDEKIGSFEMITIAESFK